MLSTKIKITSLVVKLVFLHLVELTTESLNVLKDKYLIYKLKSLRFIFRLYIFCVWNFIFLCLFFSLLLK